MLHRSIIFFCACLLTIQASAQDLRDLVTVRSRTGQFTVRAIRKTGLPEFSPTPPQIPVAGTWGYKINSNLPAQNGVDEKIQLDPSLLVVSCERLKEMLLREIGQRDQWHGRINLTLNSFLGENDQPQLTAVYRPDGWFYELVLPKIVSQKQLVRALTHALLLEIANRKAGGESAEPPFWLVEGLAANLQANNLPTYVIEQHAELSANRIKLEGLAAVREKLRNQSPLTFDELSWPDTEKLAVPEQRELYRTCAQLFVFELLRLKNGSACMAQMLQRLPQHANWQISFLEGFHAHFGQLRDVEKWWGLACVVFTGRDMSTAISREDGWKKLRRALDIPAQVHLSSNQLPVEALVTLQEVIRTWKDDEQMPVLQRTLQMLNDLRPRVTPDIGGIINKYETTLQDYLRQRNSAHPAFSTKNEPSPFTSSKTVACRELTKLDEQLEALRTDTLANRRLAEANALNRSMEKVPSPAHTDHFNSPKSR